MIKINGINFRKSTVTTTVSTENKQSKPQEEKSDNKKIFLALGGLAVLGAGALAYHHIKAKPPEVKHTPDAPKKQQTPNQTGQNTGAQSHANTSKQGQNPTVVEPQSTSAQNGGGTQLPQPVQNQVSEEAKTHTVVEPQPTTVQNGGGTELPQPVQNQIQEEVKTPTVVEPQPTTVQNGGDTELPQPVQNQISEEAKKPTVVEPQPIQNEAAAEVYGPPKPIQNQAPEEVQNPTVQAPQPVATDKKAPVLQDNVAFWLKFWDFSPGNEVAKNEPKVLQQLPIATQNPVRAKLLEKPKTFITPQKPTPKQKQGFWNKYWDIKPDPAQKPQPEAVKSVTPQAKEPSLEEIRDNAWDDFIGTHEEHDGFSEPFVSSGLAAEKQAAFIDEIAPKITPILSVMKNAEQEKAHLEQIAILFDFDRKTPQSTDHLVPNAIAIMGDKKAHIDTVVSNLPLITGAKLEFADDQIFSKDAFKSLENKVKEAHQRFKSTRERTLVYVGDIRTLAGQSFTLKRVEKDAKRINDILDSCAEKSGVTVIYNAKATKDIPKEVASINHTGFSIETR